jgi:hypothetical protein
MHRTTRQPQARPIIGRPVIALVGVAEVSPEWWPEQSAETFDGFLVRDIAVADLPPTSLIAQNQAFIAWCARSDRWGWGVFLNPLLARQLCGGLDDVAMPLLSLNLGGGFSVDSICHLADCPGLAIQRTFDELFSNAPHFADALRIVLVNRLCEHKA